MARAFVAVVLGILSAFVSILVIEAIGALVAPAGVAPSLKDTAQMQEYLRALPLSAYAFVLAAYLFGSAIGGVVAARAVRNPVSRVVWVVGGILLVTTIANLVLIPHPLWFSIASVVAIFVGTGFASVAGPARAR